jgi:hypothetical protein
MPIIDLEYDPAKELYINAEAELLKKNFFTSMNMFLNIWREYPSSPLAPKALYASGWILENELSLFDSAVTVYDSIVTRYPQTAYASRVRPKVSIYRQEMERVRIAREDSIRIVQQAIQDSLNALEQQRRDSLRAVEGNAFEMIDRNYVDSLSGVIDTTEVIDPNMIDVDAGIGDPDRQPDNRDPLYRQHMDTIDSLRRHDNRGEGIDSLQRDLKRTLDSLNQGTSDGTGGDGGSKPPNH